MATTVTKNDDPLRPDAPLSPRISSSTQEPTIEAPDFSIAVDQLDVSTLAASLTLPGDSTYSLSPSASSCVSQQKKHPFSLSDLLNGTDGKLESLGPDIVAAEISLPGKDTRLHFLHESLPWVSRRQLHRDVVCSCGS